MRKILILSLIIAFLAVGCTKTAPIKPSPTATSPQPSPSPAPSPTLQMLTNIREPISNAQSRITKKPFGIYFTKQNSPVQPEKFSGYHTGTDFETFDNEKNADVEVYAACDGKLLLKKYATGYGGVALQSCKINGEDDTIVYGHLRLSSITPKVGDNLKAGDKFALLGTGYSTETDGERKHLHFGIHKGTSIVLLGYVQKQTDLSGWLNAEDYLK